MRAVRRLLAASAFLSLSCSLGSLGEYDIPTCERNDQCDPLNEYYGLSRETDCITYHCRSDARGCELRMTDFDNDGFVAASCAHEVTDSALIDCQDDEDKSHPGSEEICDGHDNDCDGVIDEETAPHDSEPVLWLTTADPDDVDGHVYFGNPQPAPVMSSDRDPAPVFVRSVAGQAVAEQISITNVDPPDAQVLSFRYQRNQDTKVFEDLEGDGADHNCPITKASFLDCKFDDTVATRVDEAWILAAISSAGCRAGQLRVGYLEKDTSTEVGLRGPEQHSNLYLGVDVGDGRCTGASRDSGVEGATRLSIAGQKGNPRQALLALIADELERPACGGAARDVEVMGIWLEQLGPDLMWTNGANDGLPQVLGQTSGGGRPVVQAIKSDGVPLGYLVAYGASDGGLALHRLPLFEDPPDYERGQKQIRSTAPIELGTAELLFAERSIDHVAVTQVGVRGDHLELGLAWLEGCGTGNAEVVFSTAGYFWDDHSFEAGDPVTLASVENLDEAPTVLHVDRGLVAPGFARSDHTAGSDQGGGFFVAWRNTAADDQLHVARVLDLDGELLDIITFDESPDTSGLHLFYSGDRAYFASYEAAAGEVRAGPLQCGGT